MGGNGGSTNYRSLSVSGNIQLKKGQYTSVFVLSNVDDKFVVHSESGFSCHRFSTKQGFHAVKQFVQTMGRSWRVITNWRTADLAGSYNVGGFSTKTGRFTAPATAVYYCSASIRMDGAARNGYFRLVIAYQNGIDVNNGLAVIRGNKGSTNYGSLAVTGSLKIWQKRWVSLYVYSSSDNSWQVQAESSFGCHQMGTRIGFHAEHSTNQIFRKGWSRVAKWRTAGNNELYSYGGGISSQGYYSAPENGYYACGAQVRIQSGNNGLFRMIIAINNKNDVNLGLHVLTGNQGSTNYRSMSLAGTVYLKKGDKTSVNIYSATDTSWYVNTESGFSCHKFVTFTKRC